MKIVEKALVIIGLIFNSTLFAQTTPGDDCTESACLPSGSYPTAVNSPGTGSCGCLGSTPNPMWISIFVPTSGQLHWVLTQTSSGGSPIDVDFALFGPFTSMTGGCPTDCNSMVDCSYSASATENIDITNAVAGQYYNLLVTNFNGSAGTVNLVSASNSDIPISTGCNSSVSTSSTPATCGQATGSVTANPVGPAGTTFTYSWSIPGNPTTQTVNNVPPGTYTVTVTPVPSGPIATATVTVANLNATYSATSTPASCPGGNDGTATANFAGAASAGTTATYLWSNGQTTQTATGLLPGAYTCTITLSNGCSGTASTTVGANAVAYNSTSTLVSCPGGADGTATANMVPVVGTLSFAWNDPAMQTTQTAIGLMAGTYTCTITSTIGCTGTTTATVTEIPGMIANFVNIQEPTCNSLNDGVLEVNVTQGTPGYTYFWDKSFSTTNMATDLIAGVHNVTITDINGCNITATQTIGQPDPLSITFLTPSTQICPEDEITLNVTGAGGSTPYTFTWSENGNIIGTGTSIIVDPVDSNTIYCVKLTEACGSPSTDSCLAITFPLEIYPNLLPDTLEACEPGYFEFQNTSSNPTEIATTYFAFSDGNNYLETGADSTSNTFQTAGTYDVIMTVTSIYGCVYEDTLTDIIEVHPTPNADFTFSANPATIFETSVQLQDRSSDNVVLWDWYSPHSTPSTSSVENPSFIFPEVEGAYPVTLIVTTENQCQDSATIIMHVVQDILFYAPNAFTPDGDEHNQHWGIYVQGIDIYQFELLIYNRWGEIIWESHDPSVSWDGTYNNKIVPSGAYSWIARVKSPLNDDIKEFQGAINVLK